MAQSANIGRKALATSTKQREAAEQGIKQLWPPEDDGQAEKSSGKQSSKAWEHEVDVVFVPGFGAPPEESWQPDNGTFNWAKSENGLRHDVRNGRFLLYTFESAWRGRYQAKEHLDQLAISLLRGLKSKRSKTKEDGRKPIVLIGHSMGGLIIAKAIVIAQAQLTDYPYMFQSIGACFFFGTPFEGAAVAAAAAMYAQFAEKFGKALTSSLLDLMKPENDELRMLKDDFLRVATRGENPIYLHCFYETEQTDFSHLKIPPILVSLGKFAVPRRYADFVTMKSATLPGFPSQGLASDHRSLVKFESANETRYRQYVHDPIIDKIKSVHQVVKRRLTADRGINIGILRQIDDLLQGAHVKAKREVLKVSLTPSDWITSETDYLRWLSITSDDVAKIDKEGFGILVCGREGRGKTGAALAVIDSVEKQTKSATRQQQPLLSVYFFCEPSPGYATAEDLLKSLILQLVHQEPTLAAYPKTFLSNSGEEAEGQDEKHNSKQKRPASQVTVENLWKCFQDMLFDPSIGKRLYITLNNLHILSPDSESTKKLMDYISSELESITNENFERTPTRWFLTSRDTLSVAGKLKRKGICVIDLEDEAYGNKVQLALRQHAKLRVQTLREEKDYNRALTYFASSLIGKRAENTQWIDIISVLLQQLPKEDSDLKVRQRLESVPQDLKTLLNLAWQTIFTSNAETTEEVKEMLRTLVLTYEDPTDKELGVLAGFHSTEQSRLNLRTLVDQCKPLLTIEASGTKQGDTVCFLNSVVKAHLLTNAEELLGLSPDEVKWQHGVIAHRCFTHLNKAFNSEDLKDQLKKLVEPPAETNADDKDSVGEEADHTEDEEEEDGDEGSGDDDSDVDNDNDDYYEESDEDDDDADDEQTKAEHALLKDKALPYTVKHWLHHASKATVDIADDLSMEDMFWEDNSRIRRSWLFEFSRLTEAFSDLYYIKTDPTVTALHISASVGFSELTAALIRNGHKKDVCIRDKWENTPLHLAASFGRANTAEVLLKNDALIDDGIQDGYETPMHMAAHTGQTTVVARLINAGADCNAISSDGPGPVLNYAILSGNKETVEAILTTGKAVLTFNDDVNFSSPLAMAAKSTSSMFEYVLGKCKDLPPAEYSKALISAAENGDEEIFDKLLQFSHPDEQLQSALEGAGYEENWHIVRKMLGRFPGLDYGGAFEDAATNNNDLDSLLRDIWTQTKGNISSEVLNDSLYQAVDYQKTSTVQLLLDECKANPNATGDEYGNALTAAAYDGNMEILQLLLDAGADVNSTEGWALQTAATEGHMEIVNKLLEMKADINAIASEDFGYGTAIQGACENGDLEMVNHLLNNGADPDLGSGDLSPPIVAATYMGEDEILAALVDKGADVNQAGPDKGITALFYAGNVSEDSVRILLNAGANLEAVDSDGDTALTNNAMNQSDTEAIEILLDHGADLLHINNDGKNVLQMALFGLKNGYGASVDVVELLVDRIAPLMRTIDTSKNVGSSTAKNFAGVAEANVPKYSKANEPDQGDVIEEEDIPVQRGYGIEYSGTEAGAFNTFEGIPASARIDGSEEYGQKDENEEENSILNQSYSGFESAGAEADVYGRSEMPVLSQDSHLTSSGGVAYSQQPRTVQQTTSFRRKPVSSSFQSPPGPAELADQFSSTPSPGRLINGSQNNPQNFQPSYSDYSQDYRSSGQNLSGYQPPITQTSISNSPQYVSYNPSSAPQGQQYQAYSQPQQNQPQPAAYSMSQPPTRYQTPPSLASATRGTSNEYTGRSPSNMYSSAQGASQAPQSIRPTQPGGTGPGYNGAAPTYDGGDYYGGYNNNNGDIGSSFGGDYNPGGSYPVSGGNNDPSGRNSGVGGSRPYLRDRTSGFFSGAMDQARKAGKLFDGKSR